MNLLTETKYECRVSSVLKRNNKENGKKFMFDGKDETYWSSDQGTPQFITLDFETGVEFSAVRIQFQGGFAGKDCTFVITKMSGNGTEEMKEPFYPEDVNKVQTFTLKESVRDVKSLRLVFDSSFDFFGRIVIYSLEVMR